jgi:hypothetical protein
MADAAPAWVRRRMARGTPRRGGDRPQKAELVEHEAGVGP